MSNQMLALLKPGIENYFYNRGYRAVATDDGPTITVEIFFSALRTEKKAFPWPRANREFVEQLDSWLASLTTPPESAT